MRTVLIEIKEGGPGEHSDVSNWKPWIKVKDDTDRNDVVNMALNKWLRERGGPASIAEAGEHITIYSHDPREDAVHESNGKPLSCKSMELKLSPESGEGERRACA